MVGKATSWKVSWCLQALVSELFCMEISDNPVMDFLAARDTGKFLLT
jgi:hypothetical protein